MSSDRKHISRVKTGKTNGWQVRMMRENIKHSKFFSVKRFGGVAKALESAKKYRDSLVKLAPPSQQNAVDLSPNAGICLETCGSYKAWVASWVDESGKRRRKKFNVRTHGNLKAKTMARKARMLGIARLDKPTKAKKKKKTITFKELVS